MLNKLISSLFFLLFTCNVWAINTDVFLSDGSKFSVGSTAQALYQLVETDKSKKILIFVHGRGKHPKKGLKIIPTLEKKYGARVMMFHWESWIDKDVRPVQNAKDSSVDLFQMLDIIQDYKYNNPDSMKNVEISLLVHSMGSLVVEEMLKHYKRRSFRKDFLDNVILNQSDSQAKNHHQWLGKADFQKKLYVTNNSNDFILIKSMELDPGHRLGLGLDLNSGPQFTLAKNAIYMDLTQIVKRKHRTYMLSKSNKHRSVLFFFNQTILGEKFSLSSKNQVYRKWKKVEAYEFRHPSITDRRSKGQTQYKGY